ncbi:hypothetical protein BZZ01_23800 [Nostocales cyanobacterium HT-58-2]|nr:hypothetical protein BZZ01_23800 [Nostocales cyanobacterium HT-58-2]
MKLQKLESIRGFAAIYVLLGHLIGAYNKTSYFSIAFRFGQEAVMLFFLLSGFVIYYSSNKYQIKSFKNYFIRRIRRIYPLFICTLFLSYVFASLTAGNFILIDKFNLIGNLLMLQDFSTGKPGIWFNPFLENLPLWSLSYEWWFYMMFFPIDTFFPNKFQKYTVIGISITGYVTYFTYSNQVSIILMYFVIWWSGVELAKEYCQKAKVTFSGQKLTIITLALFCLLLLFQVMTYKGKLYFGIHPILELRHFFMALILIILGIAWQNLSFFGFKYTIGWFCIFAPISYGIYILHIPIMISFNIFKAINHSVLEIILSLALTLLLAYLLEVKLQKKINKFSAKFIV